MSLISTLKSILKPSRLRLSGSYDSYEEALAASTGYSDEEILLKVYNSTKAVLDGNAAYERDGYLFKRVAKPASIYTILSTLDLGDACIVDFGGGLGSLYINNKDIFAASRSLTVVEQDAFVKAGRQLADNYKLPIVFASSISSLSIKPNIVVLSSVLQYVPNAYSVLHQIVKLQPEHIILDRTAFGDDRYWSIQLNDGVYPNNATYPHRCLNKAAITNILSGYSMKKSWTNPFDPQIPVHEGVLFTVR